MKAAHGWYAPDHTLMRTVGILRVSVHLARSGVLRHAVGGVVDHLFMCHVGRLRGR